MRPCGTYAEQLVYDIERLRKHFPAVPVKIILVDVELPPAERAEMEQIVAAQDQAESLEDQE